MKHRSRLQTANVSVINVPRSFINIPKSSSTFTNVTVHRRLKTQNSTSSQSNGAQQNSAYTRQTKSSFKTNSNIKFISSKDRYETTQNHHKQKKKTKKLPYISMILFILLVLTIIAAILCIILINSNQKKKIIANAESVLRWNSTGITIAGVTSIIGTDNMHLNTPFDLALDYQGTMFIADRNNHRIQKYVRGSINGTTVAGFGNGTSSTSLYGLNQPSHIIVDDEENLYISNHGTHKVLSWSHNALSGIVVAGFGGAGSGLNQLNTPYGIEFDKITNTLYVADYNNHRIMVYAKNATSGTVVIGGQGAGVNRTQLYNPVGIYLDYISNSLLIANHEAHNVVRWIRSEREWILMAGDINGVASNTSTTLSCVFDMIFDPMGNMYVADRDNRRIQLFMSGEYVGQTIGGITGELGKNASLFRTPRCVKLDNQLNLYVADSGNHRIQKFLRY